MIASLSARLASSGRCSENLTPATLVAVSLNGPPLAWPGLRSNVSIWLGPPFIHKRMQARFRLGSLALRRARFPSHPDIETPTAPIADIRSQSRRESEFDNDDLMVMFPLDRMCVQRSMVEDEFAAIQQHPEHVGKRFLEFLVAFRTFLDAVQAA